MVGFVAPEIAARKMFPAKKFVGREGRYRVLSTCGAVFNVVLMMVANLVGFALGVDGVKELAKGVGGSLRGWATVGCCLGGLYTGIMVMKEIRASEKRKGVDLRC